MKVSRSHSTQTETSKKVIDILEKSGVVKKISRGVIKNTKSKTGQKSIKITEIKAGLKLSIRGNGAVQDLYAYTTEKDSIKIKLQKLFLN